MKVQVGLIALTLLSSPAEAYHCKPGKIWLHRERTCIYDDREDYFYGKVFRHHHRRRHHSRRVDDYYLVGSLPPDPIEDRVIDPPEVEIPFVIPGSIFNIRPTVFWML